MFTWNSGVVGNVQHSLASFAPDRGERLGERRDGSSRRAPGRWHATSSQAVHPASGRDSKAVAHTRRLHFAKKLIDETTLPMSEVALASGFGCVRRFNAAIQTTYHRTPSQIRRLARQKTIQPENQYIFHLRFRPPYHWSGMLAFLAARATPGVEAVESGSYFRSILVGGMAGYFGVSLDEEHNSLRVCIQFGDPRSLFFIIERIRAMFDLNADWMKVASHFEKRPRVDAAGRVCSGAAGSGLLERLRVGNASDSRSTNHCSSRDFPCGTDRKSVWAGVSRDW